MTLEAASLATTFPSTAISSASDSAMLTTKWRDDGLGGAVFEEDQFIGFVSLVADWHEPQDREAQTAWVVQFLAPDVEGLPLCAHRVERPAGHG